MLFRICAKYNLHLQTEPTYGGRGYLEKQDFIIEKKNQLIAEKNIAIMEKHSALESVSMKLADMETLVEEVAEQAYEKACEVVTDTIRQETQKEDIKILDGYSKWLSAPERTDDKKLRDYAVRRLETLKEKFLKSANGINPLNGLKKVAKSLQEPERKKENLEQVKDRARISLKAQLSANQKRVDDYKSQYYGISTKQTKEDEQSL